MANPKIVLTRIDNRLVHGQVGVTCVSSINATKLIVVDDEVANDPMQQSLMRIVVSNSSCLIYFFSIEKAAQIIPTYSEDDRLFIVVKTPQIVRLLYDLKLPITKINVGNMHYEKGKLPLNRKVYCDQKDYADLLYLNEQNVELFLQDVPGTLSEPFHKCRKLHF